LLEFVGIDPERVQFSWVSASEGNRFAALIEKVVAEVKERGPERQLAKQGLG
jgi:coenzyme F420-reducing hydrogenase delta subunit